MSEGNKGLIRDPRLVRLLFAREGVGQDVLQLANKGSTMSIRVHIPRKSLKGLQALPADGNAAWVTEERLVTYRLAVINWAYDKLRSHPKLDDGRVVVGDMLQGIEIGQHASLEDCR